jgi:hypothetical protein
MTDLTILEIVLITAKNIDPLMRNMGIKGTSQSWISKLLNKVSVSLVCAAR